MHEAHVPDDAVPRRRQSTGQRENNPKIVFVVLSCHKDGIQVYAVHAQLFQIVNIVGNTPQCAAQFAAYGLTMIVNGSILNGNAFDP